MIGIEYADGTIRSVYCHNDGYPEGVGRILVENYKTVERVEAVMKLGALSSLGREPVSFTREEYDAFGREMTEEELSAKCLSYKGWRDDDVPADEVEGRGEYVDFNCADGDIEYLYLFDAGSAVWRVHETAKGGYDFVPVVFRLTR
ncbi:hypothetical protein [Bifidobacterium cuniculi]|nr:hypothetical protein [Bifidobacterium cuniculi]